ncbi:M23 family metallopeptidase [Draconibacterium halophilum]|uniref:Peptidoglycan DD-metalloendopeptidase family protein n=1 Tax=Draconibacterium halophilum TaxID=2706887 RepID=A0A6C0RD55_9BACT|nr:peptidoglycan DD-metalloendopeptidase family protein [Draconibacterium halophilum]QIA08280.1 peptidoglycan DD-metalloendopeptidase family protein [Draconibacterium halophilum]
MIHKFLFLLHLTLISCISMAQYVEVEANYTAIGDCIFSASNNAKVPMYLHINFADLENTTFDEPLPYIKKLSPGFNSLFTLQRDLDADIPRFNYEIKTFRSNPTADVDLDFPYLIPFKERTSLQVFDVKSIDGFWGNENPESWFATGFYAKQGEDVFASRNGIVAEIAGNVRTGDSRYWYHTWTNSITIIQHDGTLMCYYGVKCNRGELAVGQKVFAGQKIGELVSKKGELIVLIFHDSLFTKKMSFIIPQFVINDNGDAEILNSAKTYQVSHPILIKDLEMTRREKRKHLRIK